MFNVYSFNIFDEDGEGLRLVAASSPEEAVELLQWSDNWQHPENADKTVKVLEGVKSDRKGELESFWAYKW